MKLVLARTEQFLNILKRTIEQHPIPIKDVDYHEGRATDIPWEKYPYGFYWGKNDTWYRFRTVLTMPEEYDGKRVRCRLLVGREGKGISINPQFLVRVNGKIVQALDANHYTFDVAVEAKAGASYEVEFEAYAGRELGNISLKDSPLQFALHMYWHHDESEKLYFDLEAAKKAAEMYPEDNYYRIKIETYLTNALNMLDCRQVNSEAYFASVRDAAAYMQEEFYEKCCGHEEVIANCI